MGKYKIILNSFGLQVLKPALYVPGPPLQNTTGKFVQQTTTDVERFDTGRAIQRTSMLGTPVFSDMILSYGNDLELQLDVVLIDITAKKNIVETKIVGRAGTVKENISDDDYSINIKGVLYSETPNIVPSDALIKLNKLRRVNDTINVISPFLDLFDIFQLVIKDVKIGQQEGKMNIIPFTISAVSDEYLSIYIED